MFCCCGVAVDQLDRADHRISGWRRWLCGCSLTRRPGRMGAGSLTFDEAIGSEVCLHRSRTDQHSAWDRWRPGPASPVVRESCEVGAVCRPGIIFYDKYIPLEPARGKNLSVYVEPWRYMHLRYFLMIWIKTLSFFFSSFFTCILA